MRDVPDVRHLRVGDGPNLVIWEKPHSRLSSVMGFCISRLPIGRPSVEAKAGPHPPGFISLVGAATVLACRASGGAAFSGVERAGWADALGLLLADPFARDIFLQRAKGLARWSQLGVLRAGGRGAVRQRVVGFFFGGCWAGL
jgi:hypothetical protein